MCVQGPTGTPAFINSNGGDGVEHLVDPCGYPWGDHTACPLPADRGAQQGDLTPGGRDGFVRDDTAVTRRALESARAATLKALCPILKWVGVALLVISCALAV